jgi:PAS domain S-box-containing protein
MNQTISAIQNVISRPLVRLTTYQKQAIWVSIVIAGVTTWLMPNATSKWISIPSFLPAYQTATISCYAVVAYLIFGYFKQTRLRALLYLWSGCVYTSAILTVQFLSFPSAFVPTIRLLGGSQTPSWLWFFWHLGSTGMLFAYAWSEWRSPGRVVAAPLPAFWKCAALTAGALVLSILAVTVFHDQMPVVDVNGDFSRITQSGYAPLIQVIIVAGLALLWRATRFSSPISAWLGVAMVALIFDNAITMAGGTRLSIGWYVGRLNALISAVVMLGLYLKEVNRLYMSAAATAGDLVLANTRLATEHTRLLNLFDQAPGFVAVLTGPNDRIQIVNAAFQNLVGARELVGLTLRQALPELETQGYFELIENVRLKNEPHVGTSMKISLCRDRSGALEDLYIDVLVQPNSDMNGHVAGIFIQGNDVTEQRRARLDVEHQQQQLEILVQERTQKLEATQTALMHAQKLEAIGKLTGGVAHDFNNVLHIINGNIDIIKMFATGNQKVYDRCDSAQTAVKRGAKLSSQLLSFARKQPLQPIVISLPEVFTAIDLLLKRAVGQRVEICFEVCEDAWNIMVDPQQLENVILNLALNAGDAMPSGGKLTISVDNVCRKGDQFVHIAFRDTGEGMAEQTRERAFEPFFSTKGIGKGTGLGLSVAHGFVNQSGGDIEIDSTLRVGTTIHIMLPRTNAHVVTTRPAESIMSKGGSETVLVVDDELEILDNVATMLRNLGYRVIIASSADQAMTIINEDRQIDLLFTDVIMPGQITSTVLAQHAQAQHPELQVLFTSGYTENAVMKNGRLNEGVNLLSKPYSQVELADAVRNLLSRPVTANMA